MSIKPKKLILMIKHDVVIFNEGLGFCHVNKMDVLHLRNSLTMNLVLDGYFYIQWLIPVSGSSKWHTNVKPLTLNDVIGLSSSKVCVDNIFKSIDHILYFFNIDFSSMSFKENVFFDGSYWLRGIGHEEKKLSRIMICLYQMGFEDLANSLKILSIELLIRFGFKTGRDYQSTVDFWDSIFVKQITY